MSSLQKNERRLFGRREMALHAWVQLGRRREACMIRNLSERGALIEFDCAAPRANTMRLIVDFAGFEAECDVRHRQPAAIGVFFRPPKPQSAPDLGPSGAELARQIRELWKQAEKA